MKSSARLFVVGDINRHNDALFDRNGMKLRRYKYYANAPATMLLYTEVVYRFSKDSAVNTSSAVEVLSAYRRRFVTLTKFHPHG
jgi:hypothetical protein